MTEFKRPLVGCTVNLSISESEDSEKHGFPEWQVNRTVLQIVAAFFGQGISLVFGHDWREDGVMEAVHGFAQQMQAPIPLSPKEAIATGQPLLWNLLPWPDVPHLPKEDLERLASTLRINGAGLPEELKNIEAEASKAKLSEDDLYIYIRARGLTYLRHKLGETANARLCLGGRRSGSEGRYPGVIEEALLGMRSGKPLYLAGILGGATQQVIDAIEGKAMPKEFSPPTKLFQLYQTPPISTKGAKDNADCLIDRNAIWAEFNKVGKKQIAAINGLTEKENEELFHTPALDEVIKLVLTGLSRL